MKVTEVPAHTGLADAAMVKLTGSNGFTVMIRVLEVAGVPVAQVAFEVTIQLTASPFTGIKVKSEEVAYGTVIPLIFH